jgi:hypothetical protein
MSGAVPGDVALRTDTSAMAMLPLLTQAHVEQVRQPDPGAPIFST